MRISKFSLLLLAIIFLLGAYLWWNHQKFIEKTEDQKLSVVLNKLHSVSKLVIWEQDFALNDFTEIQKKYFGLFTTSESLITTINGKMGFHIDLSDTVRTKIHFASDTLRIDAPLKITYVSLDLSSLNQVKDRSLDPTLSIDKEAIIKSLDKKALLQYLPVIISSLQEKGMTEQEKYLQRLTSYPVRLRLSSLPQTSDWK